jgi:IclR family transcriptional regulator, KDG regulon repressor
MEIAQTADHALRILLSLGEDGPQTVAELSDRLGLARTVARRLIVTLQQRSFVQVEAGRISVGGSILEIAAKALPEAYRQAQPVLDGLARELGETVALSVLNGAEALVVALGRSEAHPLRVEYPIGFRHPVTTGAAGRALLFNLPEEKAEAFFAAASAEPRVLTKFRREREQGYVFTQDELKLGVHGLAVALRIAQKEGSLSIVAPARRGEDLTKHLAKLRGGAARLSAI